MQRDQARYLFVIGLLGAAVLAAAVIMLGGQAGAARGDGYAFVADVDTWQRTERARLVRSPYDFSLAGDLGRIPLALGEWTGEDVPQTNLEVFILLEPEQYVQRKYTLPDGRFLWLSLIGSRKSKSFHSPQICYDADGWRTDAASEPIPLDDGELTALRLAARKPQDAGGAQHAVLYFYLWPDAARDPQDGMVLVKLTAPIYGSLEETLAMEKAFFRWLFTSARPLP
jgi:hypothetical protein